MVIVGPQAGATVTVTLSGDATETKTSTVSTMGGDDDVWRVELGPYDAGGSYAITVACDGCKNARGGVREIRVSCVLVFPRRASRTDSTNQATNTTIEDVTFGDVYLCSGQSNMELGML